MWWHYILRFPMKGCPFGFESTWRFKYVDEVPVLFPKYRQLFCGTCHVHGFRASNRKKIDGHEICWFTWIKCSDIAECDVTDEWNSRSCTHVRRMYIQRILMITFELYCTLITCALQRCFKFVCITVKDEM
jgi:hypothetical protein